MSYWSILKTADAIYFVHLGTTVGLGPSGILGAASVLGDMYYSKKIKIHSQRRLGDSSLEIE
jgi:hypothetical protein